MKRDVHKSYAELIRDPRWIDFAAGVKELRENRCEHCDSEESLEVHHLGYKEGRLPWEYAENELAVLCHDCHEEIHIYADTLWNEILKCQNRWLIYECAKAVKAKLADHRIEISIPMGGDDFKDVIQALREAAR